MALVTVSTAFYTGDSASDVDDIAAGGFLAICQLTLTAAQQQWFGKSNIFRATTANLDLTVLRATTSLSVTAAMTNFSQYKSGQWLVLCGRYNTAGVNGDQQLLVGTLVSRLAEPSAYAAQTVGSGAVTSDAANNITLLSTSTGTRPVTSPTFAFALFNTYPSLADFYQTRDALLRRTDRPTLPASVARAVRFDRGPGTLVDLRKQVTFTPTGTFTSSADPIRSRVAPFAAYDTTPSPTGGRGIRWDRRRRFIGATE